MANRHKVIYVEARKPKAGTFPVELILALLLILF